MTMSGISLDISTFLPWFKRINEAACERSTGQECEIHMDNARSLLRINDFNPEDRTHSKASFLEKALSALEEAEAVQEVRD